MNNAILKLLLLFMPALQAPTVQAPAAPTVSQAPGASASPSLFVPLGFQLGPGDTVEVTVFNGAETTNTLLTVAADGTLLIPFGLNRLFKVSGMTQIDLRDLIDQELRKNFRNPAVQVIQKAIESKKVTLAGEVTHPGAYPVTGDSTLLDLLLGTAGGFGGSANISQVKINRRLTGAQFEVNLLSAMLGLDKQGDVKLEPGDIVYVPSVQSVGTKIFILTEGKSMTLLQTAEKLNLLEALARGGGAAVGGGVTVSLARVVVIRADPKGGSTIVMDVDFTQLYKKGDLSVNVPLENGDIVFIPKNILAHVTDILNAINPFTSLVTQGVLFTSIFKTGGF